ncbi:origin recognition complex subunit 4 [Gonapodya sp. JEL0774]|nr:origin recognition complex subunit 4 [Gonapodya sp. JEL0774]
MRLARTALTVRVDDGVSKEYADDFESRIETLFADATFKRALRRLVDVSNDPRSMLWAMMPAVAQISPTNPYLAPAAFDVATIPTDFVAAEIRALPPLPLVLLSACIRLLRRSIPYFNFAMCWDEYRGLVMRAGVRGSAGVERWKRGVALKAWDLLHQKEFIQALSSSSGAGTSNLATGASNKAPKEHRMYRLMVDVEDVERAAGGPGVPAEVRAWARDVSFNPSVLVAFTYAPDQYDRTSVPAAKITSEEAREVVEMRWEFNLYTQSLLAHRAMQESRPSPRPNPSGSTPFPSLIPQPAYSHHRRSGSGRHIQPHPPIGVGPVNPWLRRDDVVENTVQTKPPFDYAEAFAAHFNVPVGGREETSGAADDMVWAGAVCANWAALGEQ